MAAAKVLISQGCWQQQARKAGVTGRCYGGRGGMKSVSVTTAPRAKRKPRSNNRSLEVRRFARSAKTRRSEVRVMTNRRCDGCLTKDQMARKILDGKRERGCGLDPSEDWETGERANNELLHNLT